MEPQTLEIEVTKDDVSINRANKDESSSRMEGFIKDEFDCVLNEKEPPEGQVDAGGGSFGNEEKPFHIGDGPLTVLKQKVCFLQISHNILILS